MYLKTFFCTFCFAICVSTALFAQNNSAGGASSTMPDPNTMGTMSTKPSAANSLTNPIGGNQQLFNLCLTKPDLHITTFTTGSVTPGIVEGIGATQTRRYAIKFIATIKNSGGAEAGTCKLESRYSRFDQNNFFCGGYYNVGALISTGTQAISGVINIRVPVSHSKVKLSLLIDSAAGEEFLPPFNKVDECREHNNNSQEITIQLK